MKPRIDMMALRPERLARIILTRRSAAHTTLRLITTSASTSRRTYRCAYCQTELATESSKYKPTKHAMEACVGHVCQAQAHADARRVGVAFALGLGEEAARALSPEAVDLLAQEADDRLHAAFPNTSPGSLGGAAARAFCAWAQEERWPYDLLGREPPESEDDASPDASPAASPTPNGEAHP